MLKTQRHRDTEKTQSPRPPEPQTRRHEDTKNSRSHPLTHQRRGAETQRRRGAIVGSVRQIRLLMAEQTAIRGSPSTGKKSVCSERKHSSQPAFSPAAAPSGFACRLRRDKSARRFCLAPFSLCWDAGLFHLLNKKEKWRGLRSESAGRWTGEPARELVFGAVDRPSGFWPSNDGQKLATPRNFARDSLRLCVSAPLRSFGWAGDLYVFVSSCLRRGRVRGSAFICVICGFSWVGGGSVSSVSLWFFCFLCDS
jgi:hypothetical protein